MISLKIFTHLVLCALLLGTVLFRMFRTNEETFEAVRLAFWLLAVAAIVGLLAPWAHHLFPWAGRLRLHWSTLLLEAGIVAVQFVTAKHWQYTVPNQFQRPFVDSQFAPSQYDSRHAAQVNAQAEAMWHPRSNPHQGKL